MITSAPSLLSYLTVVSYALILPTSIYASLKIRENTQRGWKRRLTMFLLVLYGSLSALYAYLYAEIIIGVGPLNLTDTAVVRPLLIMIAAGSVTAIFMLSKAVERMKTQTDIIIAYSNERQEHIDLQNSFIANASHELRTPLALIQGFASMLLLDEVYEDAEKAKEFLNTIHRSTQRMVWVVNNILQVQQVKAGIELDTAVFDLAVELRSVIESFRYLAKENETILRCGQIPISCAYDGIHDYIALAISNLINNAIKFSPHEVVTVSLICDDDWVSVVVDDTGIGIPANKLGKIFDQFYQVDGSDRRRFGGTGIGLYFVSQAAARHGGHVDVESAEGVGSTFTLRLPVS